MNITEISPIGEQVLLERKAILIGISINNSYFKKENLHKLIAWATSKSESVYIMIPDEPAVYTLVALGSSQKDAERIARLKSNNLENKCNAIISDLAVSNAKVIRWKDLTNNLCYIQTLNDIQQMYISDEDFKHSLRTAAQEVVSAGGSRVPAEGEIDTGVEFLFRELSFISHAEIILGETKTAYLYHKTMQVLKEIFAGHYGFKPSACSGFITAS